MQPLISGCHAHLFSFPLHIVCHMYSMLCTISCAASWFCRPVYITAHLPLTPNSLFPHCFHILFLLLVLLSPSLPPPHPCSSFILNKPCYASLPSSFIPYWMNVVFILSMFCWMCIMLAIEGSAPCWKRLLFSITPPPPFFIPATLFFLCSL